MKKILFSFLAVTMVIASAFAKDPEDSLKMINDYLKRLDSIDKKLSYQKGIVTLKEGLATINVPANFKFLGPDDAEYVVTELWGNPKGVSKPLGLIVPANESAVTASYAFIVDYEAMGYVKDNDADKINYDDLLKELKEGQVASNAERKKLGLETMNLEGWASKPYYDKDKKVLHWAKEYSVEGAEENTLNYDIRVLGRKGVLNMQAVAGVSSLDSVKAHINDVLSMVSFNEGNKYSDFNSKTDEVAAWTIGGLVAGKILAKVGLWAVILKFLKFIVLGVALAGGAIWKFIKGRKKKQEEFVYQPQQANEGELPANP